MPRVFLVLQQDLYNKNTRNSCFIRYKKLGCALGTSFVSDMGLLLVFQTLLIVCGWNVPLKVSKRNAQTKKVEKQLNCSYN